MLKCLASWEKYCPDYEIKEWNEDNFNIEDCPEYVQQAYSVKAWAFVTDVVRLMIVYKNGGIYLDTAVEIIKPLDDLLANEAYFGFEDKEYIATGLGFGAAKGNPVVKRMLDSYKDACFINDDGSYDKMTCPVRNTRAICSLFPSDMDVTVVNTIPGATLYPKEFFSPWDSAMRDFEKTENTYSIHWFSASWLSEEEKIVHEYKIKRSRYQKLFGKCLGNYLIRIEYLFLHPARRKIIKRS